MPNLLCRDRSINLHSFSNYCIIAQYIAFLIQMQRHEVCVYCVQRLLLHGNCISSLRMVGLRLPASLRVLTLASNLISDLNEVSARHFVSS